MITDISWLSWISATLTETNSLPLRLTLIFLLGLLMSLTPCIYPMIPITAGILQTQASKSIVFNFLLALSYTVGIATTYAILGLLAAFAGQAIGSFMNHPAFIIPLVSLLVYLSLSMIGLYDMYIPRFLQPRDQNVNGGSFVSAFIFGAMSGIVASPCLSPGLVCLLCLVTTLNSMVLGFLFLFIFGIGLSIPLLIIGTFSSSLSLLPRAGIWMVEVKKIFGFIMLGMCLYFLNHIIPWHIMSWIIILFGLTIAVIFFVYASQSYVKSWRIIYRILAILILILSTFFMGMVFLHKFSKVSFCKEHTWLTKYDSASQKALENHKLLFVDIGAPFCSICKAIDKKLFCQEIVLSTIEAIAVPVKVDGADAFNAQILQQYKVIGFPTILLINPETGAVLKRWGPELHDRHAQQFIDELKNIAQ